MQGQIAMNERQTGKSINDLDKNVRGSGISSEWKRHITWRALDEFQKNRMVLTDEILIQMQDSGDLKELPERGSIAKIISYARNHELDKPWSIAASIKYKFSPEANRDLLEIWRYSIAIDSPISIRQAKWLVYIRNFYPPTVEPYSNKVMRNLELISRSWLYSIFERVSIILKEEDFDSTPLDALFLPEWELATALQLGKIHRPYLPREALEKIKTAGTSLSGPARSVLSVEQAVWHNVRAKPPQGQEMNSFGSFDKVLPEEADLIAAYWLNYLSKGPLWNNLPTQPDIQEARRLHAQRQKRSPYDLGHSPDDSLYSRQNSVRKRLFEWVAQNFNKPNPEHVGVLYYLLPATPTNLNPDLLKAVGYEITKNSNNIQIQEA